MIEMMVVVVIMGLFFVVISQFTQNSNIQQTNVDRLANHIYDSIRGARNNMLIGRGIFS
jgi:Tfp pilus assembly protein FimT